MTAFRMWLVNTFGAYADLYYRIAVSLLIILLLIFLRRLFLYFAYRRIKDVRQHYLWRKSSAYTTFFLGILIIGSSWLEGIKALSTFLGLLSAGLAIAMREPLVNLAGWGFILWRRPFDVGDRIQIGDHRGDVIDTRIFQFSLLEIGNWVDADQSTGRIINIPNGKVFTEPLANYTLGFRFIWDEAPVLITFESDWEKAKGILKEVANRHAEVFTQSATRQVRQAASRFMISVGELSPTVYTTVKDSGVLLTVRYLVEPENRRAINEAVWEDVLRQFAEHSDIDLAYPTQRFFNYASEGKERDRQPRS
jgi:small-conductance mechanosensitive channel